LEKVKRGRARPKISWFIRLEGKGAGPAMDSADKQIRKKAKVDEIVTLVEELDSLQNQLEAYNDEVGVSS